jgi:dolichol kinase
VVGLSVGHHVLVPGSKKTMEGTAAGAIATLCAWAALSASPWGSSFRSEEAGGWALPWCALFAATLLSSLLEAVTLQLDNLFVPLHYFALLACIL